MKSKKKERHFKRYKHKSDVVISSKETSLTGKTVDYSLKGVGFIIDGAPDLPSDSGTHFRIESLNINDEGTIVWSQISDSTVRGGIERKSISGSLKHYRFADILIDLKKSEKNGTLVINNNLVVKHIYIKNGDMIFADSNKEEDRFLEILLSSNKITSDEYYRVIDISEKKGKSHGATLVDLGLLKPENLLQEVKSQVEEIILSIFRWEDGDFVFLEDPFISDKIVTLTLSAANLIYRGTKRIKNLTFIESVMPSMDEVLSSSTDPINLFQDIPLEQADKDILFLVDGKRSISDLISLSPSDRFQTLKTLYVLICVRIVDLKEERSPKDRIYEDVLKEPTSKVDSDFLERVDKFNNKLHSGDYYGILNIDMSATLDTIKKAYYTLAKEFHPDKHLHLQSETLKNNLNSIFSRLTSIYKVLSDTKKRNEYDQTITVKPAKLQNDRTEGKNAPNNIQLARIRFREGEEAFRKGAYARSKELFGQAVYLNGTVPDYHFHLGLALAKERNFREAGRVFNTALKISPMNADYLAELGHIYIELGFKLRATSTFEKAISVDPLNKRATQGLQVIKDHAGGW
jgi:curved DNA-binding protein CbpA